MDSIGGIRPDITVGTIRSDKKPVLEKPSLIENKDEMIKSLTNENAKLRAELQKMKMKLATGKTSSDKPVSDKPVTPAEGKIVYDLSDNLLKMRGVKTKDTFIDRLDVKMKGSSNIIEKMMSMATLLESGGHLPTEVTGEFRKIPMEIQDIRMRIPEDTATRAFLTSKSKSLKQEGISNLGISFKNDNRIVITGTKKNVISIPFSIKGKLSVTEENQAKFEVENMKVMGFFPVPKLIQTIAMVLSDDSMTDNSIERKGDSYYIDPSAMLPKNIKLNLTDIKTKNGELILEAGK